MSRLIHHLPLTAAMGDPDRLAFRCLDEELSAGALAEKAARLAYLLKQEGVRPGDCVGILLRKSLHSAVAIYGITMAGAIYVPLDPTAPPARLAQILAQCGIAHLVSDSNMLRALAALRADYDKLSCVIGAELPDCPRCYPWEALATTLSLPPANRLEDDPAYIMFTSGSTGVPKGMLHSHRSGLSYAACATALYDIGPQDRMANHSALHFDMSTFAMFGGPMVGAPVIIIPDAYARLPAQMSKLMQDERISIWYSVPFALIQLLEFGALEQRDMSALRWVIFAGEPFVPRHLRALMARWAHVGFSNNYGPAEVNVCTYHHISLPEDVSDDGVPIGRVWDIAEGLIVDEADQPVRPGGVGELLIRSSTRMRGYWNAPDLTEKALYRRPVCDGIDDIFYRTGDLVIEGADGVLQYRGRKDRQVKLRGFRVELSEVELAFAQHPDVTEAAAFVVAAGTELGVAVTLRPGAQADAGAILSGASGRLPAYAVPKEVHILESFPRTATEKVDHKALAAQFAS